MYYANNMSENEILKDKLVNWLQDEGFQVSLRASQPNADFSLRIDNAFGIGYIVNVFKHTGKSILTTVITLLQPPEVQELFASIDEKERLRFIEGLKRELLKIGADFNIPYDIGRIAILRVLYVEDLTRTSFIDGIRKVRDGAIFIVSSLSQKIPSGTTPTQPSPSQSNSTPYG